MDPLDMLALDPTRRHFLSQMTMGVGAMALGGLSAADAIGAKAVSQAALPHFAPKARRIIYLFQSGGPSQLDLFDYKPILEKQNGREEIVQREHLGLHGVAPDQGREGKQPAR